MPDVPAGASTTPLPRERGPPAVPNNLLVTGPPRSGKTTAIERAVDRLAERGYEAGGLLAPELREGGDRVGFALRDVLTGDERVLAHVDRESGPTVGTYRVDVAAVDDLAGAALRRAASDADYVVVDEVAPMQLYSDAFVAGVELALDDDQPLVAAAAASGESGFVGTVKARDDAELLTVTEANRDDLPAELAERVAGWLG
jgi:nucleoside-triphosphatase